MKKLALWLFLGVVVVGAWFLLKGKKTGVPPEKVIAWVGNSPITESEFKYSYEFAMVPPAEGKNARRAYLDYMIKERLLALDGAAHGFDRSPYVVRRLRHREYNDLLEGFYGKYVHGRVKIPEKKLEEALKKSTVTFKLRIWPTRSKEEAEKARAAARKLGLKRYIESQLKKREMQLTDEKHFETDYLDFLDVRPEILNGIKDLQVGEISQPIPFDNGYALFQVVDFRRASITTEELKHGVKRKRMENRLHDIQADSIVHSLMDSVLTPMKIRVKGDIFQKLAPPLYAWVQARLPFGTPLIDAVEKPDTSKKYLVQIHDLLGKTLVTYSGGRKTVRDYINYMDYFRRHLKHHASLEEFKKALATEIGRMMKNDAFVSIARKDGFEDSTFVVEDLKEWKQKWTYEAYRQFLVKDIHVTDAEVKAYFKRNWRTLGIANVDTSQFENYEIEAYNALLHKKQIEFLNQKIEALKRKYPIRIDEKRLAALDLPEGKNHRSFSFLVLKRFSGQLVFPSVDPNWISF